MEPGVPPGAALLGTESQIILCNTGEKKLLVRGNSPGRRSKGQISLPNPPKFGLVPYFVATRVVSGNGCGMLVQPLPVLVKIFGGYFKGFKSKSKNRSELSIQLKINCSETHVKMMNFPKF
jgi:hypothetical protein